MKTMSNVDIICEIKQLNCQKAKLCNIFITQEMSQGEFIFLLQEPYLFKGKVNSLLKGYEAFYTNNGRAAIIAHKSFNLYFCSELSDKDFAVCATNKKIRCF